MILARLLFVLTLLAMSVTSTSMPDSISGQKACPIVRIEAERLPDMNMARSGHSAFVVNGEVTVVGGHTSGFVLTPTAEYFKDGEWHLLQTVYPHDGGFSLVLQSGKVLVAGGFKDNLGIGQSYEVEMYDPVAHRFDGFGCLDQKRASAAALELDSGRVFITGNWYADDGMEIFDGQHRFSHLKPIRQPRYLPQLFRTSDGDVMMVGYQDNRGKPIDTLLIERMKGEAFRAPLFDTWQLLLCEMPLHGDDSFIGDKEKGDYAYLLPVRDKDGQVAIAEVRDTIFSLLPTDSQVPTTSQWGEVYYYSPFYADRPHQRGYVMGCDSTGRQYALCVDYAKKPAQLTLYHTDPLTETIALTIPVMTDDGNLILTGIKPAINYNFNFTPTPQVWQLRFYDDAGATSSASAWWWVLGIAVVLALLVAGLILWKRHRVESEGMPANSDTLLMQRITQLMEEKQRFKDPDLKISDVALELNTNVRYVSDCIKNVKGCSFTQYVNGYRIEHAQKLLREQPDLKISHIYLSSGFSNDSSFFRIFKSVTGTTPNEWKKQQND